MQGKYETDAHDSLTHAHRTLKIQVASDSALEKNAQVLGLETASTRGDGNCLQYAVNESHRQQTGKYIADNDNLRLLATALTRAHLLQQAAHLPQSIIEAELRATNAAAHGGCMDYPGTYMNALAAIRHGPIIVLHETPGSSTTYEPLESMLTTICGHQVAHPTQTRPLLPPVYILHRTSTNPPHFNATKQTKKQTHNDPKHQSRPRNLREREPPRQPEIETIPPPAAKRPKTSPPPKSPVLPSLYTVTRASHKTLGKERSTNTGDTEDKNDNHDSKKGSTTGNHFESIAGDHIGGDEGTSREVDHNSKAREQEPKEVPPRAKRPTAADWNEMNRNQRQHWRQRHK